MRIFGNEMAGEFVSDFCGVCFRLDHGTKKG